MPDISLTYKRGIDHCFVYPVSYADLAISCSNVGVVLGIKQQVLDLYDVTNLGIDGGSMIVMDAVAGIDYDYLLWLV